LNPVEEHYESLLAARYTWMMGGAERCASNAQALLDSITLPSSGVALDLGSGPGYHAKVLAKRGYRVVAVDISESCLKELREDCAGLNVETVTGELTDRDRYSKQGPFAAILCVGDTLTHLNHRDDVSRLLDISFDLLAPRGVLLLEFREQRSDAKNALFTTRAERDRIMQCQLQFEPERVWVTDVVHEWAGDRWHTLQSTYAKLRLSGDALVAKATAAGHTVKLDETRSGRRVLAFEQR